VIGHQQRAQENCHPTAPDRGFEEIALDIPIQYVENTPLHMILLARTQHRLRILETIPGFMPYST